MRILYGVPGEGMGHATRSKVIIGFLLKEGHEVQVVSSARAFKFLERTFPGMVHEIKGFHFAFKNAEVSKTGTFLLNLKSARANLFHNLRKKLIIDKSFKADLVISDFESFSYVFAKLNKLPIISIDNMQVMDRCRLDIEISRDEKSNYQLAKNIVQAKVPGCDHYVISSFFNAEIKKKNTSLVPPIVRQEILNTKISNKGHVLMYQTSGSLKTVQKVLEQLPNEQFYVYGMNQEKKERNVHYKLFSESGFMEDLSAAKAVIANGGFSFISEAVYLHKPIYSFPIKNQFEQWMNAAYIEKLGYGRHFNELSADHLKAFLYDLSGFQKNLERYRQDGNEILFAELRKTIRSVAN